MKTHTVHGNAVRTAIGYVRVSTHEQASEGVSLDAQRDKLTAYCKLNDIRLIDIVADEGVSGGTLERTGLQKALGMLSSRRADTLIVAKLDQLTRSVRDLCFLVDHYFSQERYHLLSVCGMVNTHSAAGRMLMLNLANYAQFEREIIAERTREALQHMKAQGIKLGHAPYGYRYAQTIDAHGRRSVVPISEQQDVICRMAELLRAGQNMTTIAKLLTSEGIPAPRGGAWRTRVVNLVLEREGHRKFRPYRACPQKEIIRDKARAAERSRELRVEGLSIRQIAARLSEEGYIPLRGGRWHPGTVFELLRHRTAPDLDSAAELARKLRAQGLTLREIAARLLQDGHIPRRGCRWHPSAVANLLSTS